jgi:hypothetical protein
MTDRELLQHLKEQVKELQSRGTAQLIASRQAAYEMAAQECDNIAALLLERCNRASNDADRLYYRTSRDGARSCADAIRALAKR